MHVLKSYPCYFTGNGGTNITVSDDQGYACTFVMFVKLEIKTIRRINVIG